jgi:hypothetical protein
VPNTQSQCRVGFNLLMAPCHLPIQAIAAHDTHGVDVVVTLLLTEHVPSLPRDQAGLVLRMRVCTVYITRAALPCRRCFLLVYQVHALRSLSLPHTHGAALRPSTMRNPHPPPVTPPYPGNRLQHYAAILLLAMMETRPADDVTERIALAIDAPQLVCLRNPAANGCARSNDKIAPITGRTDIPKPVLGGESHLPCVYLLTIKRALPRSKRLPRSRRSTTRGIARTTPRWTGRRSSSAATTCTSSPRHSPR